MTPGGRPRKDCRTNFEANLLCLMAEAGIEDYAALALAAGISTTAIQLLCSGKRKGSFETMIKLATALNCKVDDLVPDQA